MSESTLFLGWLVIGFIIWPFLTRWMYSQTAPRSWELEDVFMGTVLALAFSMMWPFGILIIIFLLLGKLFTFGVR